jgi:hypothetical protein
MIYKLFIINLNSPMIQFKPFFLFISLLFFVFFDGYSDNSKNNISPKYRGAFDVTIINPLNEYRTDAQVVLRVADIVLKHKLFKANELLILDEGAEIPYQSNDLNMDGNTEEIAFVINLGPKETKKIRIYFNTEKSEPKKYKKRTQTELSVKTGGKFEKRKYIDGTFKNTNFLKIPPEHTENSLFIRYEGPGWESDKVAYRFYLDHRNGFCIFGKKIRDLVLQNVGLDGFDSYNYPANWGQNIFDAGKTLGIGSFGMMNEKMVEHVSVTDSVNCQIVLNGAVESLVRTNYMGWKVGKKKYNATSDLSIWAGSRITNVSLNLSGGPESLVAGFTKKDASQAHYFELSPIGSKWGIIASFGKQSLMADNLGLALIYPKELLIRTQTTESDYLVVLKPKEGKINYSFLATWEQDVDSIKSEEEFTKYLNNLLKELNNPLQIIIENK